MPAEPPPRPWRLASRLLVISDDALLAIRACDPADAAAGEWFEIPGGGVEAGETTADAALRETAEETGYRVPPACVGPACWHGETTYTWLGTRHWAEMVMHLAQVPTRPERGPLALQTVEVGTFLATCWLPLPAVLAGAYRFFPGSLAADLPRLLAGELLDTGFEVWS